MNADLFITEFCFSGSDGYATDQDLHKIFEMLEQFPRSPRLWNFCGDSIQLSSGVDFTLQDAKKCYDSAIEVAPDDPEGYESLGFWHDIQNELDISTKYFELAIERTDSDTPRHGLARVLVQLGRKSHAIQQLNLCTDQHSLDLKILRDEISDGRTEPKENGENVG